MDTTNKHDWGLVIAGVLLVICSMFFLFAPGLALVTITVIAGAAFLVSGIFDIVNYFRFRRAMDLSGWALAYGALDIVLGILFFASPVHCCHPDRPHGHHDGTLPCMRTTPGSR